MLKPYKRISKRELKQDKFVTYTLKTKEYIENNTRLIMWGAVLILAVIVISSFLMRSKRHAEIEANDLLGQVSIAFAQGNVQQGEEMTKQLVENYEGVKAAGRGCFMLAKYYWQQSDFTNAKYYFSQYLDDYDDDPLLSSAAYAGYADCLLDEGSILEAARNYEKAARVDKNSPQAPSFLYSAARVYMEIDDLAKAEKLASEIMEKYDKSEYKSKAEILLSMIKLKA